jgi:prophage regulatory protein
MVFLTPKLVRVAYIVPGSNNDLGFLSNDSYHEGYPMRRLAAMPTLTSSMNLEPFSSSTGGSPVSSHGERSQKSSDGVIFLRLPEVKTITGLSKSSLYALIRANSFPAPVHLGPRTVAWVRSEVNQWAAERVLTSRSAASHPGNRKMPQRDLGQPWMPSKKWA